MQFLSRVFKGYVHICVMGGQPERFLNLCAARGILISRLYEENSDYHMNISVSDYRKLTAVRRKTHCKIHILSKHGLPFFFYRNRKRKAFFVGILLFVILQFIMSGFLWNIHINGNQKNSKETILNFLKTTEVYHGMRIGHISCARIAADVRGAFPDIIWVSAKIEGTQLILNIKENLEIETYTAEAENKNPCSLSAGKDGVITRMIVRSGIPQVQVGDVCKAGSILISGNIPIVNDSAEIIRYDQVAADADIYLNTKMYYYQEFPRKIVRRRYIGDEKKHFFLQFKNLRFCFPSLDGQGIWTTLKEYQSQLFLTENFAVPVYYGMISTESYVEVPFYYTEEQAKEKSQEQIRLFCEDLSKKGVQIFENNVKISLSDAMCIAKGYLSVQEQATRKVPCETTAEIPGKENTTHEQ